MNTLGERIKMLRKAAKLNQTELAEALNKKYGLNIERAMISKWEIGYQNPIVETVIFLADFFNVSVDYLTNPSATKDGRTFPKLIPPHVANWIADRGGIVDNIVDNVLLKEKYNHTVTPELISEEEKILIDLFRKIPNEQQQAFLEMGRLYADSINKKN